jgi:hypothetical protein
MRGVISAGGVESTFLGNYAENCFEGKGIIGSLNTCTMRDRDQVRFKTVFTDDVCL